MADAVCTMPTYLSVYVCIHIYGSVSDYSSSGVDILSIHVKSWLNDKADLCFILLYVKAHYHCLLPNNFVCSNCQGQYLSLLSVSCFLNRIILSNVFSWAC